MKMFCNLVKVRQRKLNVFKNKGSFFIFRMIYLSVV
jgi:hypothetical protein